MLFSQMTQIVWQRNTFRASNPVSATTPGFLVAG